MNVEEHLIKMIHELRRENARWKAAHDRVCDSLQQAEDELQRMYNEGTAEDEALFAAAERCGLTIRDNREE